jgi:hypothetical protein
MHMKKMVGIGGALPRTSAMAITGDVATGLTAAGSTQATALALTAVNSVVSTAAAGTGVILEANLEVGDTTRVTNLGANALLVYPPVGGAIQAGAANAGFSVATGKSAEFRKVTGTLFTAIIG